MSDRLSELKRQRELVRQHLEWLDREISAESAAGAASPSTVEKPASAAASATRAASSVSTSRAVPTVRTRPADLDPDRLMRDYASTPESAVRDVKRGCWIAFAASFLILGIVTLIAYLIVSK